MFKIIEKRVLIIAALCLLGNLAFAQKTLNISSPDGNIETIINIKDKITYKVNFKQTNVIQTSPISMELSSGEVWGKQAKLEKITKNAVNHIISSPFYKKKEITDNYNELTLRFKKDWALKFRIYNDGVAYRFVNYRKAAFTIKNEEVKYNFADNYSATVPYVRLDNLKDSITKEMQFTNSFENTYTTDNISNLDSRRLMFLPLIIGESKGIKICITEADLDSYPGLYLNKSQDTNSLDGVFAPYPKKVVEGGHNMLQYRVKEREDFIAKVDGAREFPWRVAIISSADKQLAESDMTYKLATPSKVADYSWVKPGKVACIWLVLD